MTKVRKLDLKNEIKKFQGLTKKRYECKKEICQIFNDIFQDDEHDNWVEISLNDRYLRVVINTDSLNSDIIRKFSDIGYFKMDHHRDYISFLYDINKLIGD